MIARHFMYKQVYFHHIRRAYDIHLKDFLVEWLPGGRFSTALKNHLKYSDVEILSAIRKSFESPNSPGHLNARRIQCREHFRRFYEAAPSDAEGGRLVPGKAIAQAAVEQFGSKMIRYDHIAPRAAAPIFPVLIYDGRVESSLRRSQVLARMPEIGIDNVYCDKSLQLEAIRWRAQNKNSILNLQ
jgi:hypothetical protein